MAVEQLLPHVERLAQRVPLSLPTGADGAQEWVSIHWPQLSLTYSDEPLTQACSIAGLYEPFEKTITVFRSGNEQRDMFTLLHEIGHHLAHCDAQWQEHLARSNPSATGRLEERLVNTLASHILVGPVDPDFQPSAQAILDKADQAHASLSACCAWALGSLHPMLVMAGDRNGWIWFAASNTADIVSPGLRVKQRQIVDMIDQGRTRAEGGYGLRYASGKAWCAPTFDVAHEGGRVVAVLTLRSQGQVIGGSDWEQWSIDCEKCGHQYAPKDSETLCQSCHLVRCPRCGGCECCAQAAVCPECFTQLSASDIAAGRTTHEDC